VQQYIEITVSSRVIWVAWAFLQLRLNLIVRQKTLGTRATSSNLRGAINVNVTVRLRLMVMATNSNKLYNRINSKQTSM
jgi:hypothetical protein